ncbi:MAG: hypothetical protein K6F53_00140 [Lachnospiraceae bacterium]|nr:hypothetical protein [Lachnospiraceae bacterium]
MDRQAAEYNRRETEAKIRKLVFAARGTNLSIQPFITDREGRFSTKKADAFIKKLLSFAESTDRKEKAFLTSFFYCTFRCFSNDRIERYGGPYGSVYEEFRSCETFQDIIEKAELVQNDRWIDSKEKLIDHEYMCFIRDSLQEETPAFSYFITMDLCFFMVTGKDFRNPGEEAIRDFDEEGFERYLKGDRFREREEDLEDEFAALEKREAEMKETFAKEMGYDSYAECERALKKQGYKDMYDYLDRTRYEEMSEEELEEEEKEWAEYEDMRRYVDGLNRTREPRWERYREEFEDRETFVKRYTDYRKLFFETDRRSFAERIENIIYGFLYENKMSVFSSDDATLSEMDLLEELETKLNTSLSRIRRKNGLRQ